MLVFDGALDTLDDGALALCGDLLRTLKGDEGHLEVVRGLLEGCLLVGLRFAWGEGC